MVERKSRQLLGIALALVLMGVSASAAAAEVAGNAPVTQHADTPAKIQYRTGVDKLTQGDLAAAETAFQESLKLEPKEIDAFLGLAEVELKKKNLPAAGDYIKKAVTQAPTSAEAQTAWGRYLYLQQDFAGAEAAFKEAIRLNPKALIPRIDLADLYMIALRKPQDAITVYRDAITVEPAHAGARYALGMALATTGEYDAAKTELEEAARLAPKNPLSWYALGRVHVARKDREQALAAFAKALELKPNFPAAHMDRGDLFFLHGEDEQAMAEYTEVTKLAPQSAEAHVKIGMIHQRHDRAKEAEQAYRTAIELDDKQAIAYNNLAWMLAEHKDRLDEALTLSQKAVSLTPTSQVFQDTLGWVYYARHELDQAASALAKSAAMEPPRAETFYRLGVVYADQGKTKEAAEALNKALTLNKEFKWADDARRRLKTLHGS